MGLRLKRLLLAVTGAAIGLVLLSIAEDAARRSDARGVCENRALDRLSAERELALLEPTLQYTTRDGRRFIEREPVLAQSVAPVPVERTRGVPRLAVVGESSADSFAASLLDLGTHPDCAGTFELVAATRGGVGTEQVRAQLSEARAAKPDVVLLVTGNNVGMRWTRDAVGLQLARVASYSCLLTRLIATPPPQPTLQIAADRLEAYGRLLEDATAAAAEDGFRLVVVALPSNRWMPPTAPLTGPALASLLEAAAGRADAALAALEGSPTSSNALEMHLRGRLLSRAGRHEEARPLLDAAVDADASHLRTNSHVDAVLRSRVRAPARLLDLKEVVERESLPGRPGFDAFFDNCHLSTGHFDRASAQLVREEFGIQCPALPPSPRATPLERVAAGVGGLIEGDDKSLLEWLLGVEAAVVSDAEPRVTVARWRARPDIEGSPEARSVVLAGMVLGLATLGAMDDARRLAASLEPPQAPWGQLVVGLARLAARLPGAREPLVSALTQVSPEADRAALLARLESLVADVPAPAPVEADR